MEPNTIGKGRLEAFSDGVIAIIVTIMVLELKIPHEGTLEALTKLGPTFCSYLLSFLVVAIMWINHHHMIHAFRKVTGSLLWLNMNLLFWMSLIPFVTGWMGEHSASPLPVALYGLDLTLCSFAFHLLRGELICQSEDDDAEMLRYHRKVQRKNLFSLLTYALSVGLAFVSVFLSYAIFMIIPALYFLPEKRLAK